MVSGTRRIRGKHVENVPHSTLLYTFYSVESFSVESYQDQNVDYFNFLLLGCLIL
jgi:hypothetical protein